MQRLFHATDLAGGGTIEKSTTTFSHENQVKFDVRKELEAITDSEDRHAMETSYNRTLNIFKRHWKDLPDTERRRQASEWAETIWQLSLEQFRTAVRANYEGLTGLYRREVFLDSLEQTRKIDSKEGACLFIDLNDLHNTNEVYGHAEADKIIAAIGEKLRSTLRPTDTACRYGGDEFVIYLEDVQGGKVSQAADRIFKELSAIQVEIAAKDGTKIFFSPSLSMGVRAVSKEDLRGGQPFEAIVNEADWGVGGLKKSGGELKRGICIVNAKNKDGVIRHFSAEKNSFGSSENVTLEDNTHDKSDEERRTELQGEITRVLAKTLRPCEIKGATEGAATKTKIDKALANSIKDLVYTIEINCF